MKSRLLHFIYAFLPFLPFVSVFFQCVATSVHSFFYLFFLFFFFLFFFFSFLFISISPAFDPYISIISSVSSFASHVTFSMHLHPAASAFPSHNYRPLSLHFSYTFLSLSFSPFPVHSFTDIFLLHFFIHLHSFLLVDFYPGRCTGLFTIHRGLLLLLSFLPESLDFFKLPLSRERNRHSLIFSPGTTSGFKVNGFALNILTGLTVNSFYRARRNFLFNDNETERRMEKQPAMRF